MHPDLQNKIAEVLEDICMVVLCRGNRKQFEEIARIVTDRSHVHPNYNWEMKDCLSMPIPAGMKYALCKDWEHRIVKGKLFVIIFFKAEERVQIW